VKADCPKGGTDAAAQQRQTLGGLEKTQRAAKVETVYEEGAA
jgi:hypothetical protein